MYTLYPSEPFLSCVAASCLHERPANLLTALNVLAAKVLSGMINQGKSGELVCRLILLLAKDKFISNSIPPSISNGFESDLPFCNPVRLFDFLKTLFGDRVVTNLARPQTDHAREATLRPEELERDFGTALVNFSHWVEMDSHVYGSNDEADEVWR